MGKDSTKQEAPENKAPAARLVGVALKFTEAGGFQVVRADKGEDGKVTETELAAPKTLAHAALVLQREAVKGGLAERKRRNAKATKDKEASAKKEAGKDATK